MTLDEACQILNVKNERLTDDSTLTNMLKVGGSSSSLLRLRSVPGEGDAVLYRELPDPVTELRSPLQSQHRHDPLLAEQDRAGKGSNRGRDPVRTTHVRCAGRTALDAFTARVTILAPVTVVQHRTITPSCAHASRSHRPTTSHAVLPNSHRLPVQHSHCPRLCQPVTQRAKSKSLRANHGRPVLVS